MAIFFNSYSRDWSWLSNFHPAPICVPVGGGDGNLVPFFPSAEHLYQFSKWDRRGVPTDEIEQAVMAMRNLDAPDARKWGRNLKMRPRWNDLRLKVMAQVLREKFTQHADLALRLVGTGDEPLWHLAPWDAFWGVSEAQVGLNRLGQLMMKRRTAIASTVQGTVDREAEAK